MIKISVVIHTYNAEKYLERCIMSVLDADEILICDMYSTDSTIEIAQKYNCKIVYHENTGFAEPARDFANNQVSSDYLLVLDSDEYASKGLIKCLKEFLSKDTEINGVQIPYHNEILGKVLNSYSKPGIFRFFKKGKVHYEPVVHAAPEVPGKIVYLPKNTGEYITHTMVDDISAHMNKWNHYTDLEVEKAVQRGKKYSLSKLLMRPLGEFVKLYFLKGGITDGVRGYMYAIIGAHYKFMQIVKIWNYERLHSESDKNY